MPLEGKTAVITGASSGIGAEVARAISGAGAGVLLVGRDEGRLKEVADTARPCRILATDLTAPGAAAQVVETAVSAFSSLDVLVHAAGLFVPKEFPDTTLEDLDRQWAINVRAPFALTQAALPHLEGGVVIFISSISGRVGIGGSSYCATKGAVEAMTRALAVELAPRRIRVNCVAPGHVRTPMNAALRSDRSFERKLAADTPWGRWGEPSDIAPTVVFLASDGASFIQGASVVIDGGWTAQ